MNFVFKRYVKDMLFLASVPADTHYLHPHTPTYTSILNTNEMIFFLFSKLDVGFDIQYHVRRAMNI